MMARMSQRKIVDNIADSIWLILLMLGTIFGCWVFCQISYGDHSADDYAVIIFKVMTGITFGFVVSGFIVVSLREATKPPTYVLHKRAMEMPPRLRRAWRI
jgi:hypothetical protein